MSQADSPECLGLKSFRNDVLDRSGNWAERNKCGLICAVEIEARDLSVPVFGGKWEKAVEMDLWELKVQICGKKWEKTVEMEVRE